MVVEKACVGAFLEGISDTGSGSELDLTSTSNSESASNYMPAVIETSNGAGCSETNSNQPSKEGHVTLKKKSLRSLRNFNLYICRGWWHTYLFDFALKKRDKKSQLSIYLVTKNCCSGQLVCYFAWMISSFY